MSSVVAALQSLDRDAYVTIGAALFIGLPVVATVYHILSQVRSEALSRMPALDASFANFAANLEFL